MANREIKLAKVRTKEGIDKFISSLSRAYDVVELKFEKVGENYLPTGVDFDPDHVYTYIGRKVFLRSSPSNAMFAASDLEDKIEDTINKILVNISTRIPAKNIFGVAFLDDPSTENNDNGTFFVQRFKMKVITFTKRGEHGRGN